MIIDRGEDFPKEMQKRLDSYGPGMWLYRDRTDGMPTLRAVNAYRGESREFAYLTTRIRIMPEDFQGTPLANPKYLHFVCYPERASAIMDQIRSYGDWNPVIVYEPMEGSTVPEELPKLKAVLPYIDILSPNAEEALGFLSIDLPVTTAKVEEAARIFIQDVKSCVIIRSGAMGAYGLRKGAKEGKWIDAFWTKEDVDKVVDVTGAGNSFLGGLAAGLAVTSGDIEEAMLYASVSASFTIEQPGLPTITRSLTAAVPEEWNNDTPYRRLADLRERTFGKAT